MNYKREKQLKLKDAEKNKTKLKQVKKNTNIITKIKSCRWQYKRIKKIDEKLYNKLSKIVITMILRTAQNLAKNNEIINESLIYAIFAACSESPMLNAQLTSVARCEFYQRKMICFAWLTLEEFIYQG